MAMPIPLPTYTVDMVRAFPDDGQRYELVEGMLLVTPAPGTAHQIVVARLFNALGVYLESNGPAYVVSPGEIEIAPTTLHCEPDILVFPSTFRPGTKWTEISGWWLAVEVLSQSSKYYDRDYKLEAYLRVGVREVWMIDFERRCCEISTTDRRNVAEYESVRWHPAEVRESLLISLDGIFRDVVTPDDASKLRTRHSDVDAAERAIGPAGRQDLRRAGTNSRHKTGCLLGRCNR